ncbi:hypothetical protein ACFL2T_05910 [Elusimicrobiota bacterium]
MDQMMKKKVLPTLLLISSAVVVLSTLGSVVLWFKSSAFGAIHQAVGWTGIGLDLAYAFALAVIYFALGNAARTYYNGDIAYKKSLSLFQGAAWMYCLLHVLNRFHELSTFWHKQFSELPPVTVYLEAALYAVPLIAVCLLVTDLLNECMVLREESSLTV